MNLFRTEDTEITEENILPRSQTLFGNGLAEALPLPIFGPEGGQQSCGDNCVPKWSLGTRRKE